LSPVEVGQPAAAIDIELADAEGNKHTLSEALKRGPVLLGLYKSACQASKAMMPMLERLQRRYGDLGLTIYGLSQDSKNVTRSFARRYDISFPILIDTANYAMSRSFDIFATPSVYLIRPDGMVAFTTNGFFKEHVNQLAAAVAEELGLPPQILSPEEETEVPLFVPG
jgi:peroxiredoxin